MNSSHRSGNGRFAARPAVEPGARRLLSPQERDAAADPVLSGITDTGNIPSPALAADNLHRQTHDATVLHLAEAQQQDPVMAPVHASVMTHLFGVDSGGACCR